MLSKKQIWASLLFLCLSASSLLASNQEKIPEDNPLQNSVKISGHQAIQKALREYDLEEKLNETNKKIEHLELKCQDLEKRLSQTEQFMARESKKNSFVSTFSADRPLQVSLFCFLFFSLATMSIDNGANKAILVYWIFWVLAKAALLVPTNK